jgi:microcystin-dependent protein
MEDFIGHILMFGGNFAIRSYATCSGQLMAISSNTALFSIIGTTYGGDGRTTFGLPDFRGRSPIGVGNGPGLESYRWGQRGGVETVTLNVTQMPNHTHFLNNTAPSSSSHIQLSTVNGVRSIPVAGDVPAPANFSAGIQPTVVNNFGPPTSPVDGQALPAVDTSKLQVLPTGGQRDHENRSPYLAVYFLICMYGIFPSRA